MKFTTAFAALVCVNLLLLTAIIFVATAPRTAVAQGTGLADNYLLVAGEIQDKFDALYLLDLRERTLHAFFFEKGTRHLQYGGFRSLDADFRHNTE
jgi:hypothetical protein